ncbi:hypothetical protein BGZ70_001479, partial [Mortierella alpina]
DLTAMEPEAVVIEHARKLSDVDVSTISGTVPVVARTKIVTIGTTSSTSEDIVHEDIVHEHISKDTVKIEGEESKEITLDEITVEETVKKNEKSTDISYVTPTDYKLDGPHETIKSAKEAFQVNYKEKFDVEWKKPETPIRDQWVYEVKSYETFEVVEVVEELFEETEAEVIIHYEQDFDPFELEKTKPLAEGKRGGNAGLSTSVLTAMITASQM